MILVYHGPVNIYTFQNDPENVDTALISFNTPGSRVDRELRTELTVNKNDRLATFVFRTPWKKLGAEGM